MQGVVQVSTEFGGGPAERSAQVGAADVADEEGVAGEDGVGLGRAFGEVEDEDARWTRWCGRGFRGPARRRPGKPRRVAILHGDEGILGFGAGAEVDGRAAAVAEFEMAGDEIGVEMSEEDVADLEAERLCVGEVLLDIALGVDDDGGGAGFVGDAGKRRGLDSRGNTV